MKLFTKVGVVSGLAIIVAFAGFAAPRQIGQHPGYRISCNNSEHGTIPYKGACRAKQEQTSADWSAHAKANPSHGGNITSEPCVY